MTTAAGRFSWTVQPEGAAGALWEVGVMRSSLAFGIVSPQAARHRRRARVFCALAAMLTTLAMVGPGVIFARQRRARPATAAAKSAEPNKLAEPYAAAFLMEPVSG